MTSHATGTTTPDPVQLRNTLTDHIARFGTFQTPQVETAFRAVPRHLFLPGTSVEDAYAPRVVVTKRAGAGTAISSASSPYVVATMLEQLDVRPGHKILEIGAGTGINAALLAELAGPGGHVTTLDIDADIAGAARCGLAAAGYTGRVTVICGDGADGYPSGAPYDRIIATAGAWDIPLRWWEQLALGGRLVVPVRLHGSGLTRSLAFDYTKPSQMTSNNAQFCGFVPMRGTAAARGSRTIRLAGDAALTLDPADPADGAALADSLSHPAHQHWTGIEVGEREAVAHLDLWLLTSGCRFARLSAGAEARKNGIANPALRWAGAAAYDAASVAYLAARPANGAGQSELGVIAHGTRSRQLAGEVAGLLHKWARARPAQPHVTAQLTSTHGSQAQAGFQLERTGMTLAITW